MKPPPRIFTGILTVFALSFALLAMAPALQLGLSLNGQTGEAGTLSGTGNGNGTGGTAGPRSKSGMWHSRVRYVRDHSRA